MLNSSLPIKTHMLYATESCGIMQSSFPMLVLPRDNRSSLYVYKYEPKIKADDIHSQPRCGIPLEHNIVYNNCIFLEDCENYNYMGEVPFIVRFTKQICFTGRELYMSDHLKAHLRADITPTIISRFIWDMHKSNDCFWTPNIVLNKNVDIQHNFLRDAFINIYKKSLSESVNIDIYHLQEYTVKTKKSVFIPLYLAKRSNKREEELVYIPIMKVCTCPCLLTCPALCSGILEYTRILLFNDN